jgi:hypothetical protein
VRDLRRSRIEQRRFISDRSSGSRKILLVLIGMSAFASGCGPETTWSVQVPSPDGAWIAEGRESQYSGPGNAAIVAGVYLRRTSSWRRGEPILNFFENEQREVGITIEWLNPSHLRIELSQRADIYFQVIKYAGIDVSVAEP